MSTSKPVVWQERQQLSTSEWTHWYSIPTPLPGLPTEGTTVSGIRYEWRALVLESDYLAERKAREAAEIELASYRLRERMQPAKMIDCEQYCQEAKALRARAEAAEADARRLDYLERELEVELACVKAGRPYPLSLFRRNMPITRAARAESGLDSVQARYNRSQLSRIMRASWAKSPPPRRAG